MKNIKKFLVGTMALTLSMLACLGFAACGGNPSASSSSSDTTGGETETVELAGGYAYYPADQAGFGLELNLYEDGTFYFAQFTQTITRGTYTYTEGTGSDEGGRSILYTVTFAENDVFAKEGTVTHNVVQDAEGSVYICDMYDSMSNSVYAFSRQEAMIEEVVQTVATYWSPDYEENMVKLTLYSNDTYALDGINGVGEAGSMGTYSVATTDAGTVYTLTDMDDTSKVYTFTAGATKTLVVGTTEYAMADIDPTATITYVFSGMYEAWGANVTLSCYSDSTFVVMVNVAGYEFEDGRGSWGAPAGANDFFTFMIGSQAVTAEKTADGAGYAINYTFAAAQFGGANVTLTYVIPSTAKTYTFSYTTTTALEWLQVEEVAMSATATGSEESVTFTGMHSWGMPLTLNCAADGTATMLVTASGYDVPDSTGTWSFADGVYTIILGEVTYTASVAA